MVKITVRDTEVTVIQGIWEQIFNPDFNYGEFALIKSQAGFNDIITN